MKITDEQWNRIEKYNIVSRHYDKNSIGDLDIKYPDTYDLLDWIINTKGYVIVLGRGHLHINDVQIPMIHGRGINEKLVTLIERISERDEKVEKIVPKHLYSKVKK